MGSTDIWGQGWARVGVRTLQRQESLLATALLPSPLPSPGCDQLRIHLPLDWALTLLSWLLMCLPTRLRWSGDCMARSGGEPETAVIRVVTSGESLRRQG